MTSGIQDTASTLDWVCVAEMLYVPYSLAGAGAFDPGTRVVAVIIGPPGPQ
jgi:hypothetical protein